MASSPDYAMLNVVVGNTTTVPSAPIPMGNQNNALSLGLTLFSGTATGGLQALSVEQSNDLQNWTAIPAAGQPLAFTGLTGPDYKEGEATMISMKYVRIQAVLTTVGVINVTAAPYRV